MKTETERMILTDLIITLRPYQWYKNLLLFLGVAFSGVVMPWEDYAISGLGFVIFCLMSGCVYILNDVVDKKKDADHPIKGKRPVASGSLSVPVAVGVMIVLLIASGLTSYFFINTQFLLMIVLYFGLMVVYSFLLKFLVIADVLTIAVGFTTRAVAGVVVIGAQMSPWIVVCAMLLALFMAFAKRRAEMLVLKKKAEGYRNVYKFYTVNMLEHLISAMLAATIMVYTLYCSQVHSAFMMITIPFVIYGVVKYFQLVMKEDMGAEPEKILMRPSIIMATLLWIFAVEMVVFGWVEELYFWLGFG
jgi:4-hydroxybenzoate polyprenyltransferase